MWGMREREESRMSSKDSGLGQGRSYHPSRAGWRGEDGQEFSSGHVV